MPGFIAEVPFAGPHMFSDQRHAENFVRYMFSQSKGHPANERTRLNLITEMRDGRVNRRYLNSDPGNDCKRFLSDLMPRKNAPDLLVDDGAYVLFVLPLKNGGAVSNFIMRHGDTVRSVGDPVIIRKSNTANRVIRSLQDILGWSFSSPLRGARDADALSGLRHVSELSPEEHLLVETQVHDHVLKTWRGEALLLASHHDQHVAPQNWHTNPFYHVHRLRKRQASE